MNEISRRLGVSKPTVISWLKKSEYAEGRGWRPGAYRTHTENETTRIIELKKERIKNKAYFNGSPYIRMDYHKRYPKENLPSLWFFDKVVRGAGLQTHEPRKRKKGQGIVERLRYPVRSIAKLGRIQQACDYIGKKWIKGRTEPIPIFATGYYQSLRLYQVWRTEAESGLCAVAKLMPFWYDHPIPDAMRIDNGMTFRGTGAAIARIGSFIKFLLNTGVTPLFSAPYQSYTNPHIEGYNRIFTGKLWDTNTFTTLDGIDAECARFNGESQEYYEYAFAGKLEQKSLKFLLPNRVIATDVLTSKRGKKVCFIRLVQSWSERERECGIVLLNRFIALPKAYLNQYVLATINLETASLSIISEHDGETDEILRQPYPYTL